MQTGYIVADWTVLIHKAWGEARKVRAIFQELNAGGAAIRVALDRDLVLLIRSPSDRFPQPNSRTRRDGDAVNYIPPDRDG